MFGRTSRYYAIKDAIYTDKNGQHILYKQRRFLPQGTTQPLLSMVATTPNDRLDLIASRTLGVADQFWRVCDANDAMNPFNLIEETDGVLRIAQPQFPEVS